ncbi:MAG: HYR domain-containing protein [Desulfobulbaceae bacterium]|nr:HYR domain-containing protein [Desulfobulbaceae bacterium]HIJ79233.1 HYR domain-containing protein [Deltaproteobacteria bacterium]
MKKQATRKKRMSGLAISALCATAVFTASNTMAEDVYLNPGYISGAISLDKVDIQRAYVKAENTDYKAELYTSDSSYTLTVNTPENGSLDYTLRSYIYSDNYKDYFHYPLQNVTVTDGQTTSGDMTMNPAIVNGSIIQEEGCTVSSGKAYATADPSQYYGYRDTTLWLGSRTQYGPEATFSFAVEPGANVELFTNVTLANGETLELAKKTMALTPGEVVEAQWNLACGTLPATIKGRIDIEGVDDLGSHKVRARKSLNTNDYVYAAVNCSATECDYSFPNLSPTTWYLEAWSYLNNQDDYLRHPKGSFALTDKVELTGGQTVSNDIITRSALINGNIYLSGTKKIEDVRQARIGAYGDYATATAFGYSTDLLNPLNGNFDLIVSEGNWNPYYIQLSFYDTDPESYLNSYIYIYDYNNTELLPPLTLTAGEVVNDMNAEYKTGTVTVRYTVENQGILSYPRLQGWGTSDLEGSRVYVSAYGPYQETTEGRVTFIGLPGSYDLKAEAYVGGSLTTFGDLTIDVIQGGEREMDIGGPTLNIASPQPEAYTDADRIVVSGKTTDGDAVKSVTVNGEEVELSATGNLEDPDEVAFSKEVGLDPGPNAITVVATDNFDKITSDTRKVFRDNGPPTIAWTPANNTVTRSATIAVTGTATDDNTITEIKINSAVVAFASTNNPDDLNEVRFTAEVDLIDGDNRIVVSAADNCELITSETHTVTKLEADTIAPTISCPADITVEESADFTLGSPQVSDNVDASPAISNNAPQSFAIGTTLVTWSATDAAGNSSSCTQEVTIVLPADTTAPQIECPADIIVTEGESFSLGIPSASDDRDASPAISNNAPQSFAIGTTLVTWSATDAAGNSSTCTQEVTIEKEIKEDKIVEFTAKSDSAILWPPNHKYVTLHIDLTATTESGADLSSNARLVSVTSDEPEDAIEKKGNSKGDGNTRNDIVIIDNNTVQVRVERSGGGDGRVYTFNYQITDQAGKVSTASTSVGVPLSIKQTPVDSGVHYTVKP